jgi:hypothetical protein
LTRAQRVLAFIESLSITSGIFAGQPFKLAAAWFPETFDLKIWF